MRSPRDSPDRSAAIGAIATMLAVASAAALSAADETLRWPALGVFVAALGIAHMATPLVTRRRAEPRRRVPTPRRPRARIRNAARRRA